MSYHVILIDGPSGAEESIDIFDTRREADDAAERENELRDEAQRLDGTYYEVRP